MIDPSKITNYDLTDDELEEVLLFWICAAGKNGTTAARLLNKFLKCIRADRYGAFNVLAMLSCGQITKLLKKCGIGCYSHKARTMWQLARADLDLRTCTTDDLETIYGIGMKTSRCFIIHSRENAPYAGIDTHMLKNLRKHGVPDVPKTTPTSKKQYKRLELEVLKLSKENGMTPAEYDLKVWNTYAVR